MDDLIAKLYFLAAVRQDRPRVLVAGPFMSGNQAEAARKSHPICDQLVIVSVQHTFTVEL